MASKKNSKEVSYFNLGDDWKVENVRELEFGTFFTLTLEGLKLYNLRIVPEGKKYDAFIGMPEEKGKDGEWYKKYAIYLDADDTARVIAEVEKQLKKKK